MLAAEPVKEDKENVEVVGLARDESMDPSDDPSDVDATEGDGGMGSSTPSSSPSMITSSSSVEGKKLRKSCSACHFEAFLNSIHTSIRPGRERAGSRRSRWLVVL